MSTIWFFYGKMQASQAGGFVLCCQHPYLMIGSLFLPFLFILMTQFMFFRKRIKEESTRDLKTSEVLILSHISASFLNPVRPHESIDFCRKCI